MRRTGCVNDFVSHGVSGVAAELAAERRPRNSLDTMMAITRRTLLASAAALAAAPALGQVASSGEVDVAIIGAGAAGIAAARRVAAAGRRFALIEAGSHVGGRCFTDTRSFGVAVRHRRALDSPAGHQSGGEGERRKPASMFIPRRPGRRSASGARHARESELEDFLAAQVRATRAIAEAARGKTDLAAARALPNDLAEWQSDDRIRARAVRHRQGSQRGLSDGLCQAAARRRGFLPARLWRAAGESGGRHCRCSSRRRSPASNGSAAWKSRHRKGRISARAIIVTVSTNVLAAGKIRFSPELPRRHLDAAAQLKLGTYERIALDMPGNPLGLAPDELVLEQSNGASTAALLANVGGTPLCFVDVAGQLRPKALPREGPTAMADFAMDWLGKLYGADIRKTVRSTQATQWIKDPWVLGGWSSAAPGAQQARRILMEPLRDRIWFAGEAVHETAWGTVNGAWESGERAAEAALRKIAALQEPEKPGAEEARAAAQSAATQQRGSSAERQQREEFCRARAGGHPVGARNWRRIPRVRAESIGRFRTQARSVPPVFLLTSATILPASASISSSVMVFSRGWIVTAMATDFLPGSMPLPS